MTLEASEEKAMKPVLNLQEAETFLRSLGACRVLVAIDPNGSGIRGAFPRTTGDLRTFLGQYTGIGWNLYFTPNRTRRALTRKPTKGDIKTCDFFHVELDPVDSVKDLPAWHERIRAKLRSLYKSPSVIWSSGNGLQALWRLDPPVRLLGDAEIERCEAINRALLKKLADPQIKEEGTWNVDRILRIPGTINVPNASKRAAGRTIVSAGNVESL